MKVSRRSWIAVILSMLAMIKVSGFQVAPAEIEAVLLGHREVVDCAVFGVPDARTGEAVSADVVLAEGASADAGELRALVSSALASYKQLKDVQFVPAVPRLPSGKVLRRELKAAYGS